MKNVQLQIASDSLSVYPSDIYDISDIYPTVMYTLKKIHTM